MMGFTTKSFRFDNDNPVLKNFVDKQSNFSSAMKYLILYYCSTHPEIEDLSEKYKEATSYAVMEQIRKSERSCTTDIQMDNQNQVSKEKTYSIINNNVDKKERADNKLSKEDFPEYI